MEYRPGTLNTSTNLSVFEYVMSTKVYFMLLSYEVFVGFVAREHELLPRSEALITIANNSLSVFSLEFAPIVVIYQGNSDLWRFQMRLSGDSDRHGRAIDPRGRLEATTVRETYTFVHPYFDWLWVEFDTLV